MKNILPCPHCDSPDTEIRESIADEYIACCNCGCRTGVISLGQSDEVNAANRRNLIAVWNARAASVAWTASKVTFLPMDLWDNRDEPVLLLVDYGDDGEHAIDDASVAITIGHNNDHNVGTGEGEGWQLAGWCWSHDHYTQGKGKPIGWLPLTGFHEHARALEESMYPVKPA